MAVLDPAEKKSWNEALRSAGSSWIACGIRSASTHSEQLAGMAGLIDWHLHGQVSRLLGQERLPRGEIGLVPGGVGRANFLLYHFGGDAEADAKFFLSRLKLLQVKAVTLAETTFPGDFLSKLKQNLGKEGIGCTKLEH